MPHWPDMIGLTFLHLTHGSDEQRLSCCEALHEIVGLDWIPTLDGQARQDDRYRIEIEEGVPVLVDRRENTRTRYEEFPKDSPVTKPKYNSAREVELLSPPVTAEEMLADDIFDRTRKVVERFGDSVFLPDQNTAYSRFYMPESWTKWLYDIMDAQHENGGIPDFAPEYVRRGKYDAAWGGNYPLIVWYLYQYYDDVKMLEEHYDGMRRWVDYLTSIAQGHLVTEGHYGDHMMPGDAPGLEEFVSSETPPPLVWTAYYYRGALAVAQAARELGNDEDAARYTSLADVIKDAFNREWFDPDSDQYGQGSQTGNLYPLVLGIVPEGHEDGVVANIVSNIVDKHGEHHHTGNTGATCLIDALTTHGHGDLLYRVITTPTYPSWGYMVAEGATTIWESWSLLSKVGDSESMIMYAAVDEFFWNDLAGIRGPDYHGPGYMMPGFREIHIEPHVLGGLDHACGAIKTVRGVVSSSWTRTADGITLDVTIPVNSLAKVGVPKVGLGSATVTEGGETVWKNGRLVRGVAGISGGSESDAYVTFEVGSGRYSFESCGAGGPGGE